MSAIALTLGSRPSRLCEKSVIQFACRTSVSVSSIRKPVALATSVGRRQLRKQFCASLAHATFHTAWNAGTHTPLPLLSEKEESSTDRKEQRPVGMGPR